MKRALILASLLLSSATANANIVTFDGLPTGFSPTPMSTFVESEMTITSLFGNFWGYPDGALHMDPNDDFGSIFRNSTYDFTFSGGAFDLLIFDIVDNQSGLALLYGYDSFGNLVASTSADGFGTINVDGFDGISSLRIVNVSSHLSIDNLNFISAIPELGTWLLMLVGFGAAGTALRLSKRQLRARTA